MPDIFDRLAGWLDRISLPLLAVLAILMALAPWPAGDMPHLVQKIHMLSDGRLTRPLDIFDLFAHGGPSLLLVAKLVRVVLVGDDSDPDDGVADDIDLGSSD